MNIQPIIKKDSPIVIAGPCSAESEQQVMETAKALAKQDVDLFRAGIWKPRTRPNSFEGVGVIGLKWLRQVKQETGMKTTTEVAKTAHVFEALKHGIDVLWLGARTTVNPFAVQEVADALKGVDIPIMIKNPINPDLKLWMGAIERIYNAGITRIAVIHRGFSFFGDSNYRNVPRWQIPIDLKSQFPDIQVICDNSHICGRRDTLQAVVQKAFDLNFDGVMTEVHPNPDEAWSDAKQQITPARFKELMSDLVIRQASTTDASFQNNLEHLRGEINELDRELWDLLGRRMALADKIGEYKKANNIAILQEHRWQEILNAALDKARTAGLSVEFVEGVYKAIHQESINRQETVMNT